MATACANRCKAQRPNISAWYKSAPVDFSKKGPVSCRPVLVQKIIQPTQLKSCAFFLSYEPSVTHISKLCLIPSTLYVVSAFVSWSSSIPSHIQLTLQLWRHSQKFFSSPGACGNAGPLLSLTTCWLENPEVEVGSRSCIEGENASSQARWYILIVGVHQCPIASL